MPEEKSDAEMRLLMLQIAEVEKNAPGKYPDYKRGIIAGTAVLAAALLAGLPSSPSWQKIIWQTGAVLCIVAFAWGAFRPKK